MKYSFLIICLVLLLNSCSQNSEECKKSQNEVMTLKQSITNRELQLEEFAETINQVEINLRAVQATENLIDSLKSSPDLNNSRERIQQLIINIKAYIDANNNQIKKLEAKVRANQRSSGGSTLAGGMKNFELLMMKKKEELAAKTVLVDSLYATIQGLKNTISEKETVISEKEGLLKSKEEILNKTRVDLIAREASLNEGYFYFGDKKDLLTKGIVKKQGGMLGMGKTQVLSDMLDKSLFKQVSIKDVIEFDLGNPKKTALVTSHPTDSYVFVTDNLKTKLQIKDAAKFWSLSKYAVVEVN